MDSKANLQATAYRLPGPTALRLFAIVPMKTLELAKSRLGEALDPEERAELAAQMLRHTLKVIAECEVVTNTAVITPDDAVFAIACEMGVTAIKQDGEGLNPALEQGRRWATQQHAEALLILPADLPLLCPEDLIAIVDMSTQSSIVIAPDFLQAGTNALLLRPPDAIAFHFGEGSYGRHINAAEAAGIGIRHYYSPRTERDLDTPPDIEAMVVSAENCA